jgi:hypothetical protein
MIVLDFYIIAQQLFYGFWQKPLFLNVISLISDRFQALHADVHAYYNVVKYDATITPQTIYLEKLLNDTFDPTNQDIVIINGILFNEVYLFQAFENNENTYVYNAAESAPEEVYIFTIEEEATIPDFIVQVPSGVSFVMANMWKLIDKHKLDGVIYQIIVV